MYTFTRRFAARTVSGVTVYLPDQVAAEQRKYDQRSFPALTPAGKRIRVILRGDLYGLWTAGTGDAVVAVR